MFFYDFLEDEKEKVREIGLAEGREEAHQITIESTRKLLISGVSSEIISNANGLSIEEIESIKSTL